MSEFRTGNKGRSHPYPATRGPGGAGPSSFAKNYASGPGTDTAVLIAGVQIPWSNIDGGTALGPDVPITPHVTGRLLVSGMVSLENISASPVNVQLEVQIGDVSVAIPADASGFLPAAPAEGRSTVVIPFSVQLNVAVGVVTVIQIRMSADDDVTTVNILAESSTLNIQEVTFPQ